MCIQIGIGISNKEGFRYISSPHTSTLPYNNSTFTKQVEIWHINSQCRNAKNGNTWLCRE